MSDIKNVELLELIAELKMSDDKSRKALGQEFSRLIHTELAAVQAVVEAAKEVVFEYCENPKASVNKANAALMKLKKTTEQLERIK